LLLRRAHGPNTACGKKGHEWPSRVSVAVDCAMPRHLARNRPPRHNASMSESPSPDADMGSRAPRYQPLVIVLAAAAAGIAADRFWPMPVPVWWAVAALAWLVWLVLWRRQCDAAAGVVVLVSIGAVGGAWHHLRWSVFGADDLGWYARAKDQPICVEAVARGGPRRIPAPEFDPMRIIPTGDRTRLEVDVVGLRDGVQ